MDNNVVSASDRFKISKATAYAVVTPNVQHDPAIDDLPITLGHARNSFAKSGDLGGNVYKNVDGTWATVACKFQAEPEIPRNGDKKLGSVFTIGKLSSDGRSKESVATVDLFVLDIDSGGTMEESVAFLRSNGLEGVVVASFSFGKARTTIRKDDYVAWAGKNGRPSDHTEEGVKAYLIEKKKLIPKIANSATVLPNLEQSAEGIIITVSHPPLEKHRIVCPIAHRLVVMDHAQGATTQKNVIDAYSRAYKAAADETGLAYDAACADISRMFYHPSVPDFHAQQRARPATHVRGRGFEFLPYFEAALAEVTAPQTVPGKSNRNGQKTKSSSPPLNNPQGETVDAAAPANEFVFDGFDLKRWAARYGKTFQIAEALARGGQAPILADRSKGGVYVECAFEEAHSGPSPQRTYVVDASDGASFITHCSGNACTGRDRLEHVQRMLELGWLTLAQLQDPELGGGPLTGDAKGDIDAAIKGISSSRSADDVQRVCEMIAQLPQSDGLYVAQKTKELARASK